MSIEDREQWERQWETTSDAEFEWSLPDVAPQLRELVDAGGLPAGRALDLGCGAGTATAFLAEHFTQAVGVDLASAAVKQAAEKQAPVEQGVHERAHGQPAFCAADALRLPFPTATFALVFDRGCLQNLPEEAWRRYFAEIERILVDGGVLQLLVSKLTPQFPSVLTKRGVRLRWLWYVKKKRGGPQFLSHAFLRRVRPPALEVRSMDDFPFVTKKGKGRRFTHAIFDKRHR
ncbi:hypothetical protein BH18ACT4_BH18ACT4_01260 [soil metagenome]